MNNSIHIGPWAALAVVLCSFSISNCTSDAAARSDDKQNVFRYDLDGITHDYSDGVVSGTLYNDGSELIINGYDISSSAGEQLILQIGEVTSEQKVRTGTYSIGNHSDLMNDMIIYKDQTNSTTAELYGHGAAYATNILSSTQVGEIKLSKLDRSNKLVSGSFKGNLFRLSDSGVSTIAISNGTFSNLRLSEAEKEVDLDVLTTHINGAKFVSNSVMGHRRQTNGDRIVLLAVDSNFGTMQMNIVAELGPGRYTYRNTNESGGLFFFNFLTRKPLLDNGVSYITISNHDTERNLIEGSFIVEEASATIVDGQFSAYYEDPFD